MVDSLLVKMGVRYRDVENFGGWFWAGRGGIVCRPGVLLVIIRNNGLGEMLLVIIYLAVDSHATDAWEEGPSQNNEIKKGYSSLKSNPMRM